MHSVVIRQNMVFFICLPGGISKQEVSTRKTTANGTRPLLHFFFFFFSGRNLIFYKQAGGKEQFSPDYDSNLGLKLKYHL